MMDKKNYTEREVATTDCKLLATTEDIVVALTEHIRKLHRCDHIEVFIFCCAQRCQRVGEKKC